MGFGHKQYFFDYNTIFIALINLIRALASYIHTDANREPCDFALTIQQSPATKVAGQIYW